MTSKLKKTCQGFCRLGGFEKAIIVLLVLQIALLCVIAFGCDEEKRWKKHNDNDKDYRMPHGKFDKGGLYGKPVDGDRGASYDSPRANKTSDLVKQVVADYKTNPQTTLEGIKSPSEYVDKDLYVFAIEGTNTVAHPYRKDLENTDVTSRVDKQGYYYGKEIVKTNAGGRWISYIFTVPGTNKEALKHTYCEKSGKHILCAGYYERGR